MTNLIIVDDHALFRMTLRISLAAYPDLCVSGEAGSGEALFALLKATPCDLVLLDVIMPGMNGVEIARCLRRDYPSLKILAISSEVSSDTVREMLEAGIEGYISKQAGSVNEISKAIHSIMDGEVYYGSDISSVFYRIFISKKHDDGMNPQFTPREKEIIELCRKGLMTKEIADRLKISYNTVRNHKNNIFEKLGINTTVEMVQYALKNGIIG
jgi:DNA-binding NarL/FixJ family response regulator